MQHRFPEAIFFSPCIVLINIHSTGFLVLIPILLRIRASFDGAKKEIHNLVFIKFTLYFISWHQLFDFPSSFFFALKINTRTMSCSHYHITIFSKMNKKKHTVFFKSVINRLQTFDAILLAFY